MLKEVKPEIRIVGFDDAPFTFNDKETLIIGAVCRAGLQLDGVITTKIDVDGLDVTEKIIKLLKNSKHFEQLRVIMLDGITFGGFNIVDIEKLFKKTKLPVIVVIREMPDLDLIKKSLKRFKDFKKRWTIMKKAGEINEIIIKNKVLKTPKKLYYQFIGVDKKIAEKIIKMTALHSATPEPVRIAHLIGEGLKSKSI
jgi:endonuclease V-like protein UPF0215 family